MLTSGGMGLFRRQASAAITGAILLAFIPVAFGDSIIVNNFGPNSSNAAGTIAAWASTGSDLGFTETAMSFTSGGDFILTQIDVALSYDYFANSSAVLTLDAESRGLPGQALMQWDISGLPEYGTCCAVETLVPVSTVLLSAGQRYWLVATAGTSSSFVIWNTNSVGQIGPLAQTFTPGLFSGVNISLEGAFAVNGIQSSQVAPGAASPEPGNFLTFSGLVLLLFCGYVVKEGRQFATRRRCEIPTPSRSRFGKPARPWR